MKFTGSGKLRLNKIIKNHTVSSQNVDWYFIKCVHTLCEVTSQSESRNWKYTCKSVLKMWVVLATTHSVLTKDGIGAVTYYRYMDQGRNMQQYVPSYGRDATALLVAYLLTFLIMLWTKADLCKIACLPQRW